MILETSRLIIIPLTIELFHLLVCDISEMEKKIGLVCSGKPLDIDTQQAMEMLYKESLLHPHNYYWYTNWQIILKSENKAIGSACFMKEPDCEGQVEIGYGMNDDYRNKGYMTEAVICLCEWALQQENVKSVIAGTEINNYSSQRVLEKSGMVKYMCKDRCFWWKLRKRNIPKYSFIP